MDLYPFQTKMIEELNEQLARGVKRIMLVAPTGSGKTVIAAEIIKAAAAQWKEIVFIAHRDELLTQARDKLHKFGVNPGIIKAGRDKDVRAMARVQVCGIQTLHARAIRSETMEMPNADILFVDECHHCPAMTYQSLIAEYPTATMIGLTATPCRGDGRGLGNTFQSMIQGPQIGELIKLGHLVPLRIFAPPPPDLRGVQVMSTGDYNIGQLSDRMNADALVGDFVLHWFKHAQPRRTIAFAVDIAHSVHLVAELTKSGVRAEHLDGGTEQAEREAILERLRTGETEVVSNCMVLTEGFDLPDIGCIGLVRPTRSLGLFRQMIGRGLRPAEGKTDMIVLDHSGGVHRHGRPDDHIEWTLHQDQRATNNTHEARVKQTGNADPFCDCPKCGEVRMRGMACDACGWKPAPRARDVETVDGELIEIGAPSIVPTETDRRAFFAELRGYHQTARKKNGEPYHPKWPHCQFKDKYKNWPPLSWNDDAPMTPSPATCRWVKSRLIAWARANANR